MPRPQPDAVPADPQASYDRAAAAPYADERQRAVISAQLGRSARGAPAVVHRCAYGLPTVVRVAPRLEDGTPFPTTFWLTCPLLRSRVGTLEADRAMAGINERLAGDEELLAAHEAALARYLAFRDSLDEPLPGSPAVGGQAGHVKCLHAHVAHHLATGDNPVGARALEQITPALCPEPCVDEVRVDAWRDR